MNKYYRHLLQISAFLMPFYLIFYGPMNDNPDDDFSKSLRKFTLAGFAFYALIAAVYGAFKGGII